MAQKPAYDPEQLTITEIDPHQVANYSFLGVDPTEEEKRVRWSGNSLRNFWQQDIFTAFSQLNPGITDLLAAYNTAQPNQIPKKTSSGWEFFNPAASGGGITYDDLGAASPLQFNDQTGIFSLDSSGFAPALHSHTTDQITGLDTYTQGRINTAITGLNLGTAAQSSASSFAPVSHTHNSSSISDFVSAVDAQIDVAVLALDLGTASQADTTDFATASQGAKADTALQPTSSLDATKLTGLVPDSSIPGSIARDSEVTAAITALNLGTASQASSSSFAAAVHIHNSSSITDFNSAVDARLTGKQNQSNTLDSLITAYGSGSDNQVPRKTSTGWEFYTPSAGGTGGIALTDLSATSPVQYNSSTGNFSFNSSSFLQTSAIGTTVQGFDADLSGLAGLSTTGAVERTGAGTFTTFTISTAGKSLIDDTDASAQRTTLGLGTAATANSVDLLNRTNHTGSQAISTITGLQTALDGFQPLDPDLTAISALTTTAYGRGFLDLADAAAGRTKLGLGTASTSASTDFATAAQGAKADTALQPDAIGVSIQAYDSDLASISGLTPTNGLFLKGAGSGYTIAALADSDIPSTIARDSEVTSAISALSTVYQPLDSDLTAIAALTTTAYGRGFLDLADAAASRTKLGLGTAATSASTDFATAAQGSKADSALQPAAIGVIVQAYDADLASIAALTTTSFGRGLLELSNAAAGRTTFGSQQDLTAITSGQTFNDQSISRYSVSSSSNANASITLAASDNGRIIECTNSSSITVTVPSGLPTGFNCMLVQNNTGQITVSAGASVTIRHRQSHTKSAGQYGVIGLTASATANTYYFYGDTTT